MKSKNSVNNPFQADAILWVLCGMLAIAYILPWLSSRSTALSLGAFDLAEWMSLHPSVVNISPALLLPLLLRIIPVLITLIITVNTPPSPQRMIWWFSALLVICIAVTMFPPLEFLTTERGNINYRQMFALCIGLIILGGIGLSGLFYRARYLITAILALVGLICTTIAMSQAYQVFADFYLPRNIGIGAILSVVAFTLTIVASAIQSRNKKG